MTAERGAAIFRGPDPGAQQRSGSSYFLQGRGGGDAVPAGRVFWRRKSTRLTMREQPGRSGISIQHPPARTPPCRNGIPGSSPPGSDEETFRDDLILEDPSRVSERLIRSDCSPDRSPGHPGMLTPPGIAAPISMIGYGP